MFLWGKSYVTVDSKLGIFLTPKFSPNHVVIWIKQNVIKYLNISNKVHNNI